jgi:hypothetical protein
MVKGGGSQGTQSSATGPWGNTHILLLLLRVQCIHFCMSNVLTVRLPGSLLVKVDRRAAALGRARAEHVRQLLEEDVAAGLPKPKRFACLHLKGRYALGRGSDNAAVRRSLVRRAYEKNR